MNNKNYNNLPKQNKIDVSLLVIIIFLSLIGITFVYSASNVVGLDKYGDSFYFFKRQSIFLIISYICMFLIIIHPDYQNKGIASSIINGYINTARLKNKRIILKTYKENPAQNLYKRLGFKIYKTDSTHIYFDIVGE